MYLIVPKMSTAPEGEETLVVHVQWRLLRKTINAQIHLLMSHKLVRQCGVLNIYELTVGTDFTYTSTLNI